MAGTTETAQLNLRITATDEAKKVFEDFATSLASTMTKIQEDLTKAFNMTTAIEDVTRGVDQIRATLDEVNPQQMVTRFNEASTQIEESFTRIAEQANTMREDVIRDFDAVASSATTAGTNVGHSLKSFNFGQIQMAGMMMEETGKKMGEFFLEAAKMGADFDQEIHNTTASLNANLTPATQLSTTQIQNMSKAALQMGSDGFFSANQIAESMNTMAKQGINYSTIMGGAINTVYQVAAANQQDLQKTANVVSDIYNEMGGEFKSMGLNVQQSSQIIGNSMTVALHHAKLSMDDFLTTMKYVGPQASAVGMSIQDVSAAVAVLGQHGIKSSQAGTTLRRMLTNLTPASSAAADEMKKLGFIVNGNNQFYDQSTGKLKPMGDIIGLLHDKISKLTPEMQQAAIKTIFGQYALSGMMALVATSPSQISALTDEMKNNGEMAQIMGEKEQGLGFQIQALKAHFQTFMKEIGMALAPIMVGAIKLLNGLMSAFTNLSPGVQRVIAIVGSLAAVALTLGGFLFTAIGTIGMFGESFMIAAADILSFLPSLTEIKIVVALAVGAFLVLKTAWKSDLGSIKEFVHGFAIWFKSTWSSTMSQASKDISSGVKNIEKAFKGLKVPASMNKLFTSINSDANKGMINLVMSVVHGITTVTGWFKKMSPQIESAMKKVMSWFNSQSKTWKVLWDVFKFVVQFAWDWIKSIIQSAWGVISGVVQLITDLINGKWKAVFQDLWQIVKNAVILALDTLGGFESKGAEFLIKLLDHTGIFGKMFGALFKAALKVIEVVADASWKLVGGIFKGGAQIILSVVGRLPSLLSGIWDLIKALFQRNPQAAMDSVKQIFSAGSSMIGGVVKGMFSVINGILGGLPAMMGRWAENGMNMFVSGIDQGIGKIGSAVKNVASTISNFLGMHSPAKMGPLGPGSDEWFPNMMKMFESGVNDNKDRIQKAVLGVAVGVQTTMQGANQNIQKAVQQPLATNAITTNNRNQQSQTVVNINIEGRSQATDKQLAEQIAQQFRTQMSMVLS